VKGQSFCIQCTRALRFLFGFVCSLTKSPPKSRYVRRSMVIGSSITFSSPSCDLPCCRFLPDKSRFLPLTFVLFAYSRAASFFSKPIGITYGLLMVVVSDAPPLSFLYVFLFPFHFFEIQDACCVRFFELTDWFLALSPLASLLTTPPFSFFAKRLFPLLASVLHRHGGTPTRGLPRLTAGPEIYAF